MRTSDAYRQFTDRFDSAADAEVSTAVGLVRREVGGLGQALFIEVLVDGARHALYPVPECDPERAAELIRSTPRPLAGITPPLARLEVAAADHNLEVLADRDAIVIADGLWGEIFRQPVTADHPLDSTMLSVLGYLDGVGWLEGVVMRFCGACGYHRPLRDFSAAQDLRGVLPECAKHWTATGARS